MPNHRYFGFDGTDDYWSIDLSKAYHGPHRRVLTVATNWLRVGERVISPHLINRIVLEEHPGEHWPLDTDYEIQLYSEAEDPELVFVVGPANDDAAAWLADRLYAWAEEPIELFITLLPDDFLVRQAAPMETLSHPRHLRKFLSPHGLGWRELTVDDAAIRVPMGSMALAEVLGAWVVQRRNLRGRTFALHVRARDGRELQYPFDRLDSARWVADIINARAAELLPGQADGERLRRSAEEELGSMRDRD